MRIYISLSSSKEDGDDPKVNVSSFSVTLTGLSTKVDVQTLYGAILVHLQRDQFEKGLDTLNERIENIKAELREKKK